MSTQQRHVDASTAWRIARSTLGRMACAYGDPTRDGHDHQVCVRDDESFIADRMLALLNAVCRDDTDMALDGLTELQAIIQHAT
jgi:hypothetical protein